MRGQKYKSIVAENLKAVLPEVFSKQEFATRKKMCWKCQKDKSTKGGHIKTWSGGSKFVCKECLDSKKEQP